MRGREGRHRFAQSKAHSHTHTLVEQRARLTCLCEDCGGSSLVHSLVIHCLVRGQRVGGHLSPWSSPTSFKLGAALIPQKACTADGSPLGVLIIMRACCLTSVQPCGSGQCRGTLQTKQGGTLLTIAIHYSTAEDQGDQLFATIHLHAGENGRSQHLGVFEKGRQDRQWR